MSTLSLTLTQARENPVCPACGCTYSVKKGKRRNRLQRLQVYRCTECLHRFTANAGKNRMSCEHGYECTCMRSLAVLKPESAETNISFERRQF